MTMFRFRTRGVRELVAISNGVFFRPHFLFSTTTIASDRSADDPKTHLIVDYLVDSLRFSREEAISASSKVTHLKSTKNCDLVLNVFRNYGFEETQIRDIVSSAPSILTATANKTLEPKIRFFHQLGLSGPDIIKLIRKNPKIFSYGLHTRIVPIVDYLRKLLGSDEGVIKVINGSKWLFTSPTSLQNLSENVMLLQNYGFSKDKTIKFVQDQSNIVNTQPKWLESKLQYVEQKLGVPCKSPVFFYAALVAARHNESTIEKKMQVFRSYGWSDSELSTLLSTSPLCLTKSESTIRDKLNFFMKELGYKPSYLATCNSLFSLSLEKRVKPRYRVLEVLKEKKLVSSKPSFLTLVKYSESQFLKFVQRFAKEVPSLYQTYISPA